MLTEDGRYGIRIHATRPESTDHRTGEAPEVIIDEILLVVEPVLIFAKLISPTRGLCNKPRPGFINTLLQPLNILRWRQSPIVEEVHVDAVSDQHGKIRVSIAESGHQIQRPGTGD